MAMAYVVRTTHGRLLRVPADPDCSVSDFKTSVVEQLSSPSRLFVKLYHHGIQPRDDCMLGSLQFKPTDCFVAHVTTTPPDASDDFEEIEIRADSEEEDAYSEEGGTSLGQLEAMFPADAVRRAMEITHGNADAALDILVSPQGGGGAGEAPEID
jgi:hypothetical protein